MFCYHAHLLLSFIYISVFLKYDSPLACLCVSLNGQIPQVFQLVFLMRPFTAPGSKRKIKGKARRRRTLLRSPGQIVETLVAKIVAILAAEITTVAMAASAATLWGGGGGGGGQSKKF